MAIFPRKLKGMVGGVLFSLKYVCPSIVKEPNDSVCMTMTINGHCARIWVERQEGKYAFDCRLEKANVWLSWNMDDPQDRPMNGKIPATLQFKGAKMMEKWKIYFLPEDVSDVIEQFI